MARVYSRSFIQQAGVDGTVTATVPPGFKWVVRDIDVYANVTVASREVHVRGPGGQTFAWWDWGVEDQAAHHWSGRVVLGPGETLRVDTSDLVDVTICGYELALP